MSTTSANNLNTTVELELHDSLNQHDSAVGPRLHLTRDFIATTPPNVTVCMSESISSNSGTPSNTFKKKNHDDLIQTPIAAIFKNPEVRSTDENQSPNCASICTSTPTCAITTSSPRLSFKGSAGHVQSPLAISNCSEGQILLGRDSDLIESLPGLSDAAVCLPRDCQPLSDCSGETAQTSFATARAHSESPGGSLIEQETSQKLYAQEFTTPFESFEACGGDRKFSCSNGLRQPSSVLLDQIQSQSQRQADWSVMGDVSMMSVDGNMSVDMRDDANNVSEIHICTKKSHSKTEGLPVAGQIKSNVSSSQTDHESLVSTASAIDSCRRKTYEVENMPASAYPPKIGKGMGLDSSERSITPTPIADDTLQRFPHSAEANSAVVFPANSNFNKSSEGLLEESASKTRLNDTFDKTPNKSNLDLPVSGDKLDVPLSTSGNRTPASKLNDTFDKDKLTLDINSSESLSKKSVEDANLNDTFDKVASEESHHNGTFDKETSTITGGAECSALDKTPDLELRIDQTCRTEESVHQTHDPDGPVETDLEKTSVDPKEFLRTPEKLTIANRIQSTPRTGRSKLTVCDNGDAQPEHDISGDKDEFEKDNTAKPREERRGSGGSFLKRRCSILELSFVSSPKRANFQPNMSKCLSENGRTSLLQHESIAFDFSAAAAKALDNNGVAEMGSFVFSSSSGQPIPSDIFDLSTLEKMSTNSKIKGEKYTRVSFLAMFDPIKPESSSEDNSQTKSLCTPSGGLVDSTEFKTPMTRIERTTVSPLVKGLPTPHFARPKSVCNISVQTDPFVGEKSVISESKFPEIDTEELLTRMAELNTTVESQKTALALYEKVVTVLKDRVQVKLKNDTLQSGDDSKQVASLKAALVAERERNAQQDDVVRNLERSMHATLKRMAECREGNAALTKVVEEQLAAMSLTRANCDALEHHRDEVLANASDEIQALKVQAQEDERNHKKALNRLELQLKAKESELESSHSQLAIAKKEIDSLRAVVQQMNLQ